MVTENNVNVSGINNERFNPFGATDEELIANALEYVGLVNSNTKINGKSALSLCHGFHEKRQLYKMSVKKIDKTGNFIPFTQSNKGVEYIQNISSEQKTLSL